MGSELLELVCLVQLMVGADLKPPNWHTAWYRLARSSCMLWTTVPRKVSGGSFQPCVFCCGSPQKSYQGSAWAWQPSTVLQSMTDLGKLHGGWHSALLPANIAWRTECNNTESAHPWQGQLGEAKQVPTDAPAAGPY